MSAKGSERHERPEKKKHAASRDDGSQHASSTRKTDHPVGPENVLRDASGEPAVSGHNSSGASEKTRHTLY